MHYTSLDVYEFISKQTQDLIVERKTCTVSGTTFPVFQSDLDFYKKISPKFDGQTFEIPSPTLCPEERERRRLSRRNERFLFRRKCDATGKQIISMYPPETTFPVYEPQTRRGDSWNALDYGFSLDVAKSFSQQFGTLLDTVPRLYMYNLNAQNSDYCNCSLDMKDSYLVSGAIGDEHCLYGNYMDYCNHCVDNLMIFNCELCYACVDCRKCYACQYCQNTKESQHSYFLYNCERCEYCLGCVNLIDKKYCLFNEQLTKEAREEKMTEIDMSSHQQVQHIQQKFEVFRDTFPRKATTGVNNENCYGNNPLSNSKNCFKCFDADELRDCKYLYWFRRAKNCYDVFSRGSPGEMLYECVGIGAGASKCIACANIDTSHDCYYSVQCSYSHHLFGCNGLKNAEYCIFNKQYSPEEWEQKVAKLVASMQKDGERGEMLDPQLSVYGYNYSVAQEFFPLDQASAKQVGYVWSDYEKPEPQAGNVFDAHELPDTIGEVDDAVIHQALRCEVTGKLFRITQQELAFYKKQDIPLSRKHPDARYAERLARRPARELYLRKCDRSGEDVISVYPADVSFEVYSEEVYNKEIYG